MSTVKTLLALFKRSGKCSIVSYELIAEYSGLDIRSTRIMAKVKSELEPFGLYLTAVRGVGYYIN